MGKPDITVLPSSPSRGKGRFLSRTHACMGVTERRGVQLIPNEEHHGAGQQPAFMAYGTVDHCALKQAGRGSRIEG